MKTSHFARPTFTLCVLWFRTVLCLLTWACSNMLWTRVIVSLRRCFCLSSCSRIDLRLSSHISLRCSALNCKATKTVVIKTLRTTWTLVYAGGATLSPLTVPFYWQARLKELNILWEEKQVCFFQSVLAPSYSQLLPLGAISVNIHNESRLAGATAALFFGN